MRILTDMVMVRSEINQWYLPVFRNVLTRPMIKKGQDGIDDVIGSMDAYTLTREDWYASTSEHGGRRRACH